MKEALIIIYILFWHYIADFVCQKRSWAVAKSYDIIYLLLHVAVYTSIMTLMMAPFLNFWQAYVFCFITFITHGVTDYFTSKWSTYYYRENRLGAMFKMIGADQYCFHVPQLILTYTLLKMYL